MIIINDYSLRGRYDLQSADFRFWAQIRSHFLLHQKVNHHKFLQGYPYISLPFSWHTNSDTPWDIPTFCCPSVGAQIMTSLGISLLFCRSSIVTQILTLLGISQHSRPHQFTTIGDTFRYIQLFCQHFCKQIIGTLFATYSQCPKQKSSGSR